MSKFAPAIWRRLPGIIQWRLLWALHSKFIVGVCGVLSDHDDRVLLLQHTFWPRGSWGLPSGYMNRGETIEQALAREVLEETGYHVNDLRILRVRTGYKMRVAVVLTGRVDARRSAQLDRSEVHRAAFFSASDLPPGLLNDHRDFVAEAFAERVV